MEQEFCDQLFDGVYRTGNMDCARHSDSELVNTWNKVRKEYPNIITAVWVKLKKAKWTEIWTICVNKKKITYHSNESIDVSRQSSLLHSKTVNLDRMNFRRSSTWWILKTCWFLQAWAYRVSRHHVETVFQKLLINVDKMYMCKYLCECVQDLNFLAGVKTL